MAKPPRGKSPKVDYISIAKRYAPLHPYFAQIAQRKLLKLPEKRKISRLVSQLNKIEHEYGAGGFAILRNEKQKTAAKHSGLKIGSFNLIKLNSYIDDKAPLKVSSDGEVIIQRAKHKYNSHSRDWHFHKVNYNYVPRKGQNRKKKNADVVAKFKTELDRAEKEILAAQKKTKDKEVALYLWGPKGIMYRKQAGSARLLLDLVKNWLSQYIPEDARERKRRGLDRIDDVLIGFAWHRNAGKFPNAPKRVAKRKRAAKRKKK